MRVFVGVRQLDKPEFPARCLLDGSGSYGKVTLKYGGGLLIERYTLTNSGRIPARLQLQNGGLF